MPLSLSTYRGYKDLDRARATRRRAAARWRKRHPIANRESSRKQNRKRGNSWYASDRGRDTFLQLTYGITLETYNQMLLEQGGVCYLCGRPETIPRKDGKGPRRLVVNHNHTTGKVRHLLCSNCNFMVGSSKENPLTLEKAAAMLRAENA